MARKLKIAPGYKGAEGENDDDWLVIDCHNVVVHLLLPNVRKAIALEEHWGQEKQPCVQFSGNEVEYDKEFDRLLEKHPVPANYNPAEEPKPRRPTPFTRKF